MSIFADAVAVVTPEMVPSPFRRISCMRTKHGILSWCKALLTADWMSSTWQGALGLVESRTKVNRRCSILRSLAGVRGDVCWRTASVFFL